LEGLVQSNRKRGIVWMGAFWLGGIGIPAVAPAQQKASDPASLVREYRAGWDATMRDPHQSPLKPEERARFHGISWFPIQPAYRVTARFAPTPGRKTLQMRTSTGETRTYFKIGALTFTLQRTPCRLFAYEEAGQTEGNTSLFIPFTDATSGHESYAGGRYLEVPLGKGHAVTLDFNMAYNPYCAYTHGFSCPIPPRENHLAVAVKAGARAYQANGH
jgi:uncharacterized protein (DUF1684 family)